MEKAVGGLPGVVSVTAALSGGTTSVMFNENLVAEETIVAAIRAAGSTWRRNRLRELLHEHFHEIEYPERQMEQAQGHDRVADHLVRLPARL